MNKIINKEEFENLKQELAFKSKKIVLCHGVFDLIHPGHIIHFQEAKSLGDILVVSITAEKYVRKGPERPYFNDQLRMQFLSAIECIDYVMLSEGYTVDDIIKVVKPNVYVKGEEYKNDSDDITGKIVDETALVELHGGSVYFTSGQVFSSTKLINNEMSSMTDDVKKYMQAFHKKYSIRDIRVYAEKMQDLQVLVVGDVIIDEYNFCDVQGLMSKDMGYSTRHKKSEQYLGGSLAVARHITSFCNNVTLCSIVGDEKDIHSRILEELSGSMRLNLECSKEFSTIVKKRFIVQNEKRQELNKLFAINNLSYETVIKDSVRKIFKDKLQDKIEQFDLVVVCDFGHGLIDAEVMDIVQKYAKKIVINCQTNSSNYGMNVITKYSRADSFTLDQKELHLAYPNYTQKEGMALQLLAEHLGCEGWLTRGSKGVCSVENGVVEECPAFTLHVTDTIGAGDALLSLVALCKGIDAPTEIGTFLGNIAGALATNIVGNKKAIDKVNVLKYAATLLNI